jgi:glycosyltransferase involved in cell wall biosynthesis
METLNHFIGKSGQLKVRLLKTLFAQELQNFDVVREFYEERFNPMLFRENMRYTRLLFKFLPNAYDSELLKKRIEKPLVSAIICAYNEERTLLSNLKSLADCELVDEVIVVNDGSSDQTGQQIQSLTDDGKVKAIHFPQNMGKSQAMVTAALRAHGDILVFIDADLTDLNSRHIQTLIQPLRKHEADMVIGDARDKKSFIKSLDPFRSLSGERAVWRQDLLPLAEEIRDSGYGIETLLNLGYKEAHKNVCYRDLEGLSHPWKVEKFNPLKATHEYLREGSQIMRALIKRSSNRNLPAN